MFGKTSATHLKLQMLHQSIRTSLRLTRRVRLLGSCLVVALQQRHSTFRASMLRQTRRDEQLFTIGVAHLAISCIVERSHEAVADQSALLQLRGGSFG